MKKDNFVAKVSFLLCLFSWIPLLNIGISLASVYLAYKAIKLHLSDKNRYGGFGLAVTSLVISSAMLIASIIVFVVYVNKKLTCEVVQCSNLF